MINVMSDTTNEGAALLLASLPEKDQIAFDIVITAYAVRVRRWKRIPIAWRIFPSLKSRLFEEYREILDRYPQNTHPILYEIFARKIDQRRSTWLGCLANLLEVI